MKLENCELDKALIDTKYNFLNCKVTTIKAIQHKIMTGWNSLLGKNGMRQFVSVIKVQEWQERHFPYIELLSWQAYKTSKRGTFYWWMT